MKRAVDAVVEYIERLYHHCQSCRFRSLKRQLRGTFFSLRSAFVLGKCHQFVEGKTLHYITRQKCPTSGTEAAVEVEEDPEREEEEEEDSEEARTRETNNRDETF